MSCALQPYTYSQRQKQQLPTGAEAEAEAAASIEAEQEQRHKHQHHRQTYPHHQHHCQHHQQEQKQMQGQKQQQEEEQRRQRQHPTEQRPQASPATTATHLQLWHILHVILVLIDITSSLTMIEVNIPNHVLRQKTALLGCRYALDGESLYSVKWYKDGHEIYRYVPRDKPPGQAFPLPGVIIDLRNSSDSQVMLRRVTLQSTGVYRCEVSGEAPAFNTVSESETMTVVVTPNHGPKITGGLPRYQIGDIVRINCTSSPSKPVCHLSWLINGQPANRSYLKHYDRALTTREGLEVARLGLEFRVRPYHFKNGDMKLKCEAKISSLYWQSNEESVESDRQQRAPALESRGSVAAKSSTIGGGACCLPSQLLSLLLPLVLLSAFRTPCGGGTAS